MFYIRGKEGLVRLSRHHCTHSLVVHYRPLETRPHCRQVEDGITPVLLSEV